MKKHHKIIIIIESILLFLLISIIGIYCFFNKLTNDNNEYLRVEYNNIKIYEIGHPIFFGNSTIRIKYKDYIFETEISNDGAALTKDNFEIIEDNGFYEITLKGCEQKDVTYYLKK